MRASSAIEYVYDCDDGREVRCVVHYRWSPPEQRTWHYPGSPAEVSVVSVRAVAVRENGAVREPDLEEQEEIEAKVAIRAADYDSELYRDIVGQATAVYED